MPQRIYSFVECGCSSNASPPGPCNAGALNSCADCAAACDFTLPTPGSVYSFGVEGAFANLETAQLIMQQSVLECAALIIGEGNVSSSSYSPGTNGFVISQSATPGLSAVFGVQLTAGILSIAVTSPVSDGGGGASLYDEDGTLVDEYLGAGSHSGTLTVPADGFYFLSVYASSSPTMPSASYSIDVQHDGTLTVCQPRAAYGAGPDYVGCLEAPSCVYECAPIEGTHGVCRPSTEEESPGVYCHNDPLINIALPCVTFYSDQSDTPCGNCGVTAYAPSVRLQLSGLIVGVEYTGTLHLVSTSGATTTLNWTFTATATTETTSYQSFPTPDVDNQWSVDSCEINPT